MDDLTASLGLPDGAQVFRAAFAAALIPAARQTVSECADAHRYVSAETSAVPGPWRTATACYLREPMDCLSEHDPAATVTIAKSAQVGGTEIAMNWLLYIMRRGLGPTMVVHPTLDGANAWNAEKLTPTINETPALRTIVREQRSRSEQGSTNRRKKFPGGFVFLAGANSAAGLRQKSIRNIVKDDWDEWPVDVDGQGDPDKMANARQIGFHAAGQAKTLQVSTPTIEGASRVWEAFEAGDQRRYHVPCPHCGHMQTLRFDRLRFERRAPHRAWYACEANGCAIEHHEKRDMIRDAAAGGGARWIAAKPDEGRQPSFHINALYSPFTTWDHVAAAFVEAKDSPRLLQTFVNLWLGECWRDKGAAPAWERLRDRVEVYAKGIVPPGGLILTRAVDVQKSHLVYEVVAWGKGLESWTIEAGTIPGIDTENPHDKCWSDLRDHVRREYRFAGSGTALRTDVTCIDSGYAAQAVYAFVRRNANTLAIKGKADWRTPPIVRPSPRDVRVDGKVRRRGLHVWQVGTYQLKGLLYALLRIGMPEDENEPARPPAFGRAPDGYCHFGEFLPDEYFQELTAEYVKTVQFNGRPVRQWVASGANHWHDCRVYNLFATEYLGLSTWTPSRWREVETRRNKVEPAGDLAALWERVEASADAQDEDPAIEDLDVVEVDESAARADAARVSAPDRVDLDDDDLDSETSPAVAAPASAPPKARTPAPAAAAKRRGGNALLQRLRA